MEKVLKVISGSLFFKYFFYNIIIYVSCYNNNMNEHQPKLTTGYIEPTVVQRRVTNTTLHRYRPAQSI
jgi:hypothetical protein